MLLADSLHVRNFLALSRMHVCACVCDAGALLRSHERLDVELLGSIFTDIGSIHLHRNKCKGIYAPHSSHILKIAASSAASADADDALPFF